MRERITILSLLIIPSLLAIAGLATLQVAAQEVGSEPTVVAPTANVASPTLPVTSALTATTRYTVTDLGTLGGSFSVAYGINDLGQVVGSSANEGDEERAFLWLPAAADDLPAGMHNLGTLYGLPSAAASINDAGQVVGRVGSNAGELHAFLWQDGAMQDLGNLGVPWGWATDINNNGQVTGFTGAVLEYEENNAIYVYTTTHAFLWQNGNMSSLGTLGGEDEPELASRGSGINDAGQVAGSSDIDNIDHDRRAFFWNGAMTDLGTLAGDVPEVSSSAAGINEAGEVVGLSHVAAYGSSHAFLWLPAPAYNLPAGMNDLGTLGGSTSYAEAINNNGQVVGMALTGDNHAHAFLWENGEMVDLNERIPDGSGWNLERAMDINDAGQIVGYGWLDGQQRAFLLTPDQPAWTVMFYLDGDNNLSHTYPEIFNRLEAAAGNPSVNVVALWDGAGNGDSTYYHVQHDTDLNALAGYVEGETKWSQGEVNMAFPTALSDFAIWAMQEFPARHYALVLDDHGSGLGGGLVDDTSGRTMNLPEMQLALATIHEQTEEKIDVLFMAMCLMGMIEDAYQFREHVDYYVANENIQWAFREPYEDYVAGIEETSTPAEVAQLFAASYADVGDAKNRGYTISVVDIAGLERLVTAANGLGGALDDHMAAITPTLTTVLTDVQRFDNEPPHGITTGDTSIDLYHFAYLVSVELITFTDILTNAVEVMAAVEETVIYERHASDSTYQLDDSHGLAVFFPSTESSFYHPINYDFAAGAVWESAQMAAPVGEGTWGAMLVAYVRQVNPNGPDDPTPPPPVPKLLPSTAVYLPLIVR